MTGSANLVMALFLLLGSPAVALAQDPSLFNDEERAWIAAHPTLRVAASAKHVPFEYFEGRTLRGLSSEYLKLIARKTGMKLVPVAVDDMPKREMLVRHQADLSFVVTHSGQQASSAGVVTIPSQQSHPLVIVSRIGAPLISDPRRLNGLTIAVPDQWPFQAELQALAPKAKIVTGVRMFDVLSPVIEGTADAAIGSELLLLPYLHRRLEGRLQIAGIYGERLARMSALVRSDEPLLQSIMQKTLASFSPDEAQKIYDNWLDFESHQIPSMQSLGRHYPHEIALGVLVMILLLGLLYQANARRRQATLNEREKAKFLAVMSHEIRSPMNAVLAAVELLRYTELTAQQRHFAELANNGGRNLLRLLNDVLDVSKLEAGQVKLEKAPVDIVALVHEVTNLHRLQADEKGIALTVRARIDEAWLMLDETRMAQILHNLLSNAVKFTAAGGVEIDIALLEPETPGATHLRLVIAVADTGIGISEPALARLFQPYAQADKDTYRRSGGTGLGLVISRELATLMKGTLTLTSTEGKGSTALLSLEAQAAPSSEIARHETSSLAEPLVDVEVLAPPHRPSLGARILIVEDVVANQEVLRAQVQTCGCESVVAEDGARAIAVFNESGFDLVLMDCDLPDKDGYSLTADFRRLEEKLHRKAVPIIAISASTDPHHIERCFESGMDGVLTKPIQLGKLQDAVYLWCGLTTDADTIPPSMVHTLSTEQVHAAMKADLNALLEAAERKDGAAAARVAHRMRGAALVMEWSEVAQTAAQVESLMRLESIEALEERIAALQRLVQAGAAGERAPDGASVVFR